MKKTKVQQIGCMLIIGVIVCLGLTPVSLADDINPGAYTDIYGGNGTSGITTMGGKILGVVQAVGTSVAVIMLAVIAIRYFTSAPDQKADIKSRLIPFVIGAILLFGASNLLSIVVTAVKGMTK